MDNLIVMTDNFKANYEKFLIACDSLEEIDKWDKKENGEMDAYYSGDLSSIIIYLVGADGNFTDEEARYIYDLFGFEYTVEELENIYKSCVTDISRLIDAGLQEGIDQLREINMKLAESFKGLLLLACKIISESDNDISDKEMAVIHKINMLE